MGQVGNNPLLASVNTQGSLRTHEANNKGSGVNISKKEAMANLKKHGGHLPDATRGPHPTQSNNNNQRVGSINSNPGSTASRGSKYNIH